MYLFKSPLFLFLSCFLFLKAHLHGLEAEREELGQQIDHLVMENRGLVQQKMSLGLEVATYRYKLTHNVGKKISLRRNVTERV